MSTSASFLRYEELPAWNPKPRSVIEDTLIRSAFEYHRNLGFKPSVARYLTGFVSHAFLWILFIAASFVIEWRRIWNCTHNTSQNECSAGDLMTFDVTPWWLWVMASIALARQLRVTIHRVRDALYIRNLLVKHTSVDDKKIQCMSWEQFAFSLVHGVGGKRPGDREVNMRLYRHDNLLRCIALHTDSIFSFGLRPWTFSSSAERCLRESLVEAVLDFETGRETFLEDVIRSDDDHFITVLAPSECVTVLSSALRTRCLWYIVIMPLSLMFALFSSLARNIEPSYSQRNIVGPRQWSPWAVFSSRRRGFVETCYDSSDRLEKATIAANSFIQLRPTPILSVCMEMVAFILGGVFGVMCLVTFTGNVNQLVQISLGPLSFVAWFTLIGVLASSARSLVQKNGKHTGTNVQLLAEQLWETFGHSGKPSDSVTLLEWCDDYLSTHFKFRLAAIGQEILSVIITPFQLALWSRRRFAAKMIEGIMVMAVDKAGVGAVIASENWHGGAV